MIVLRDLARTADEAAAALESGDLALYGEAMIRNNESQRSLHAGLVSGDADAVASIARKAGAAGWKVNGAGGDGGSMTLLGPEDGVRRRRMLDRIERMGNGIRIIPVSLSTEGLKSWEE